MSDLLRGRQTQFYIDVLYGVAFALGFGYLLAFGMDARVAAFQGGLVLGYFLRVWENMQVYERILEEEVASRAQERVEEEVETRVPSEVEREVEEQVTDEVETQVPEQIEADVEERVTDEVEERVTDEVEERVADEVEERIADDEGGRIAEEAESELLDRIAAVDADLADRLQTHLDTESDEKSDSDGETELD